MRELVHAEAAARPAGAFGIVELEVFGRHVAIHEVVGRAADARVEPLHLGLARTFDHLDLQQTVADEQRGGNAGLDRLLVLSAHDEPIDDRVHVLDFRFVQVDLGGDVDGPAVDDQSAAALSS